MKKLEKQKEVNKLVVEGKLPIAFFNSKIVSLEVSQKKQSTKRLLIPKYKQVDIPRANSNKLISKIYDLF